MEIPGFMTVGRVVKPHGLKGELCVMHYTDSPFLFQELKRIYCRLPGKNPRRLTVESVRLHQEKPLVLFREINGRDQAEVLRGAELMIRRKDLPEEDPDAIMITDLTGLQVLRRDGLLLGVIQEVQMHAGQEIWVIAHPSGSEILIPAVDEFILDIDLDSGQARIDPPPGLLELYI